MKILRLFWALAGLCLALVSTRAAAPAAPAAPSDRATLIVVVGAEGEAEYLTEFQAQYKAWNNIAATGAVNYRPIGGPLLQVSEGKAAEGQTQTAASPVSASDKTDRDSLREVLAAEAKEGPHELWLVLIGHGTFDGKEAKFNLRGADLGATELAEWLKPFARPIAVVDTSSSSAPFLAKLSGRNRVLVTSTRSGYEHNYARFGKFFAEAMADAKGDLDKDGQISLLEAFLSATHRTTEFYKTEGRLATEHALIDDNGDGMGTPSDWFKGVRATKRSREGALVDGTRAHQFVLVRSSAEQQLPVEIRAKRDALELEIAKLRESKAKLGEEAYYRELEKLLLQIAALYEST